MIKMIEKLFSIKIIPRIEYDQLLTRIAECVDIYREYDPGRYHANNWKVEVPLSKLYRICLVEYLVWDDLHGKLNTHYRGKT